MSLTTPSSVRKLQRALYAKAKANCSASRYFRDFSQINCDVFLTLLTAARREARHFAGPQVLVPQIKELRSHDAVVHESS